MKKPRIAPGLFLSKNYFLLAAFAEEAKQHDEQVDEVEIEPKRAHDRSLARDLAAHAYRVALFDLLCVIGGKASEDDHADNRDHEVHHGRLHEQIYQHRDDDADQPHEQERAPAGEIALGGVAPKAHGAEGRRGDEEHARDASAGIHEEDWRKSNSHHGRKNPEGKLSR